MIERALAAPLSGYHSAMTMEGNINVLPASSLAIVRKSSQLLEDSELGKRHDSTNRNHPLAQTSPSSVVIPNGRS
jgi:hypothetical protein